jgi:hypothetical protein
MNLISLHYVARDLITFDRISQLKTLTRQTVLSVEKAQALLLLSIVLHAHVLPEAAQECLGQAIKCGQQLGLDHGNAFVAERAQDPLHAESLRRTWWELFVIDTLLAAVQTDGVLQITSQELSNVPLPCEEGDYHCGGGHHDVSLITARDLEQSRHLFFSEERGISSLGYRIEAAILFRKSLLLATTHETTDALDAAIASWFHRLPNNKSAILNCNGELDQMMFQAVMMMHCASIYLHFPRSCLPALLPVTGHLFCSSPPRFLTAAAIPQRHTGKVLTAALDISKLASLSTSAINHSPFFCCTLMLSSIVQLAIRCAKLQEPCSANLEFLGINLSVLKSMGEIWKIAEASKLRLREVIMEIGSVIPVNP